MKGKIVGTGQLVIKRKNQYIGCLCPDTKTVCDHRCPLFGEPEKQFAGKLVTLNLCHKTLEFEEFEDERWTE